MDYPSDVFSDCYFRRNRHTDGQTVADERFTHATVVRTSNNIIFFFNIVLDNNA